MARSGIEVQRAVIKALFMREIKTRFGKYRLGYLWAVLEPAAHLMVMIGIFGYVMHRTMPDISFPVFLINGIIPFFIFSNITNRCINAIEANQGLFNYRPVKPIDTVIARASLETIIYVIVYLILMSVLGVLGERFAFHNILTLASAWFLLVLFSCGIGLVFMVVSNAFPETEKFLPIATKPLYFISAIMFPLHSVPKEYWHYLTWNPLVHVVELSREAVVDGYISEGISLDYLLTSTLFVFFFGLMAYYNNEKAMLTS
ncbi:ABC transporter permease [[Enterobacter] lignolyticus]|uniref:Transport permease protein n=1 Tax=[Enterobacter] lignolyticus TaxID=1334193 RepID=A0A806X1Z0_9ENTR|nr:ABC transporter permease [[Enterobacter] lignolyticus]ALR75346.1 polysialic acid transporter [[Enterobacter] lignolyticus]